ncbi:carbonate dehydratase, eukaryotic-type [Ancylostoma duodenale]|uniref:Carbonate dehydratase, eukaryotic-type n=1 Tax=Ancylostoma duodenale TaxID=51022 RepID=A0A0C2H6D5_9BILA|nr:carbonate dehydratase, eukaryotic-type [Ancylostoma duodenale]
MSPSASSKRPRRVRKPASGTGEAPPNSPKAVNFKKVPSKSQAKLVSKIVKAAKSSRKKPSITQRRQSPIDIKSEVVCHDPEHCKPDSLTIKYSPGDCNEVVCSNTGFKVNVAQKCSTTLSASHLPGTFQLAQFHAHWSKDGSCGSEHLLDGKAMSGEVHFVFWNTKYESFCTAAEKEDGLAVIGVFIKEGAHSANYEPLFNVIHKAIGSASPVPMPKEFVLDQLFPPTGDFIRFEVC